jgi:purine-binding chemotaxis protein CheW
MMTDSTTSASNQFVTFLLGPSEYALEILAVQEFKVHGPVTRVPNMPSFLRGVMNLRGVIVPVFDLRIRFGMPADCTPSTVIMVAHAQSRTVGLVIDGVSDVVELAPTDIQLPPELGNAADAVLRGVARVGERLVMLLDLERALDLAGTRGHERLHDAPRVHDARVAL